MSTTTFESYEVLISKDKTEVFIPVVNPTVDLYGKNTSCKMNGGDLHLSDGDNEIVFLNFSDDHWALIKEHKKVCFLDVSDTDHLKDFDVPVDSYKVG